MSDADAFPFDDVVFACTHLCDLLEVENDALSANDAATVSLLAENKAALARLYENAMLPLMDNPELADALEPEQREELLALGQRLQELVATNAVRLKAQMQACQTVMDVVVDAVKKHADTNVAYGAAGSFAGKGAQGNSISFNETL
ncbi:MAG: flagellar protein FlgN [Actinomycetota bacterium]